MYVFPDFIPCLFISFTVLHDCNHLLCMSYYYLFFVTFSINEKGQEEDTYIEFYFSAIDIGLMLS